MKLSQLAERIGARAVGDADVTGVASIESAGPADLVFVQEARHLGRALATRAAAVLAGDFAADAQGKPLLIANQPRLAFCRAGAVLCAPVRLPGVHSSAIVAVSAQIGVQVAIAERAVVGEHAVIGDGTQVGAGAVIGTGVTLGRDCDIKPNVTIYPGTRLGDRCIVHAGAVLGSDGFGFVRDPASGAHHKFPQIGRLEIGNDVEIGANTTIDRGALDATIIADGAKFDNLVHVGHNVRIGRNVVIAAQTGISGSSSVANDCVIGGQVGIGDHAEVGEGVVLGGQAGVLTNKVLRGKGVFFWGTPARPLRTYLRQLAALERLGRKR